MVHLDGPIIFVNNEHPYGGESFLRVVHVVCDDRASADEVEGVWVCNLKVFDGVAEEETVVDLVSVEKENGNKKRKAKHRIGNT